MIRPCPHTNRMIFEINGHSLEITSTPHLEQHLADVVQFQPFVRWIHTLTSSSNETPQLVTLYTITITDIDHFTSTRIGFVKMKVDCRYADNTRLPGIVLLRGDSVAIMIRVKCLDHVHVIMVQQPRIPLGSLHVLELPAGMLDGSGDFVGVAQKELEEECGIKVMQNDLVELTGACGGLAMSGGLCDGIFHCNL